MTAKALPKCFELLGARPIEDELGNIADVALIPLEEMSRPRIDVIMTLSDTFLSRKSYAFMPSGEWRGARQVMVVDTQRSYLSRGEARQLAKWLGGDCAYLPNVSGETDCRFGDGNSG